MRIRKMRHSEGTINITWVAKLTYYIFNLIDNVSVMQCQTTGAQPFVLNLLREVCTYRNHLFREVSGYCQTHFVHTVKQPISNYSPVSPNASRICLSRKITMSTSFSTIWIEDNAKKRQRPSKEEKCTTRVAHSSQSILVQHQQA